MTTRSPIKRRRKHPRPGTKYPVVNGVMTYPDGREVCQDTMAGRREYRSRTRQMLMRQRGVDAITGEPMDTWEATFDHEAGRGHGGGHRDDRIGSDDDWHNAALSEASNSKKGSRRYKWVGGKYIPAVYSTPEQMEMAERV